MTKLPYEIAYGKERAEEIRNKIALSHMNTELKCVHCNVELTEENWEPRLKRCRRFICRKCRNVVEVAYRERHREQWRKYYIKYTQDLRTKAFERLGNKCVRCGITDWRVLQIDHINGGGCKERANTSSGTICKRIIEMPEEELKQKYQLLCANDNWLKRWENQEFKKRKPIEGYSGVELD